ncbi:MAG: SGNH/GDSL hydrolase family protein [Acidimicrobiales bacterium]
MTTPDLPRPGLASRLLGRFVPGVGRVGAQVGPYARQWWDETDRALGSDGPLLAVLGDSTGQGIGASTPHGGWAGQLRDWLDETTGDEWTVANWSRSGAKVGDVLGTQLPILLDAPRRPALVAVAVGSNDVFWGVRTGAARRAMRALVAGLPDPAIVATVPASGAAVRAMALNRVLRTTADEHGVAVADVNATIRGGRASLASDGFHPNERGYAGWTEAFVAAARPLVSAAPAPDRVHRRGPDPRH